MRSIEAVQYNEIILGQNHIFQKSYYPKIILPQNHITPKSYYPKIILHKFILHKNHITHQLIYQQTYTSFILRLLSVTLKKLTEHKLFPSLVDICLWLKTDSTGNMPERPYIIKHQGICWVSNELKPYTSQ